jgi:predicted Zn finger-like uncharacterized protein
MKDSIQEGSLPGEKIMIVKCSNCDASYTVDDEKVNNRRFAFECPKCSSNVIIDNRTGEKELAQDSLKQPISEEGVNEVATSPNQIGEELDLRGAADFDDISEGSAALTAGLDNEDENLFTGSSELDDLDLDTDALEAMDDDLSSSLLDEDLSSQVAEIESEDFGADLEANDISLESDSAEQGSEPVMLNSDEDEFSDLTNLDLGEDDILENFSQDEDILSEDEIQMAENIDLGTQDLTGADENITIDLNSLDIDLETEGAEVQESALPEAESELDEEDSISLDLDALDIDLEESSDINVGEALEEDIEDSRLTIDDAGISLDEISTEFSEKEKSAVGLDVETDEELSIEDAGLSIEEIPIQEDLQEDIGDDLRLSLDEVVPELDLNSATETELLTEDFDGRELPEIDVDLSAVQEPAYDNKSQLEKDEILQIEESMVGDDLEEEFREDELGKGFINFSIDYSLKHSRLKAFLRLIGIYYLTFLPYLIVNVVYSAVALVVAYINWLVVLLSGSAERDYVRFQEKVLRYTLSFEASICDVVEEKPSFAGSGDIDYALQLNLVKPVNYSRVLTFLRMTGVGIFLLALPHIILLLILSMGLILIYIIALISILVSGKWPSVLFDFMVRYLRYKASIIAYVSGIIDTYPSFRFD